MHTKQVRYSELVAARKSCHICRGLRNPSKILNGEFDTTEIGPWTRWQGNLDSDIMLVAQDWGHVGNFIKQRGKDNNSPTNIMLKKLLAVAGLGIILPKDSLIGTFFFTNAILCLKSGGDQASVNHEWFSNCGPRFLRPLIEIVTQKVVICMGQRAYDTVMTSFYQEPDSFRAAVEKGVPVLINDAIGVFAVYHCGRRILNTHRDKDQQYNDWEIIGRWLKDKGLASHRVIL